MTQEGILQGDCIELLRSLPRGKADAIITDPPYSSGGLYRGDRQAAPGDKYQQTQTVERFEDFAGDNRDQRSWTAWMIMWLTAALPVLKPGGYIMVFTDWRQLPSTTDALQIAGYLWRGIVPWDKTEGSRAPHRGYFRHQCEYVVSGTRGPLKPAEHGGPWPGCIRTPNRRSERHHMTSKPLELMRQLCAVVPPGGLVLDPFCGGGSTGVAALQTGRRFLGIELTQHYADVSRQRLAAAGAPEKIC